MAADDTGTIRQQIGELLGLGRSTDEQIKALKVDAEKREDRLSSEIRNVKHEQRQIDQVVASRLELLNSQVTEIDRKIRGVTSDVSSLQVDSTETKEAIANLKKPVEELVDLRRRIVGYAVGIIIVVTGIWYLVAPVLSAAGRALIEHYITGTK